MNNIIKRLCNINELIELYSNFNDCDKFAVGYIDACTDNECLIHSFQENDLDDGYYVMHNDSVFEIRRRTKYLKNMLLFIKPNTEKYKLPKGYWLELDLFNVVLNLCKEERLMAMIRLDFGEECYGYINDFDDSILEIETVDSDGIPDGIEYLRIEDVRVIGFGSLEANRRSKLFETQNNLN